MRGVSLLSVQDAPVNAAMSGLPLTVVGGLETHAAAAHRHFRTKNSKQNTLRVQLMMISKTIVRAGFLCQRHHSK